MIKYTYESTSNIGTKESHIPTQNMPVGFYYHLEDKECTFTSPSAPLWSILETVVGSTKPVNFKEAIQHSSVSSSWDRLKTGRLHFSTGSAPVKVLSPLWSLPLPLFNRLASIPAWSLGTASFFESSLLPPPKSKGKMFPLLMWSLKRNTLLFSGSSTQLFKTNLHSITQGIVGASCLKISPTPLRVNT